MASSVLIAVTLFALGPQTDTSIVLGRVERDITGDGIPEILSVIAVGPRLDSLSSVTFSITARGATIYRYVLAPLTRTVGFDGGRRRISSEQHRIRLREFSAWFFDDAKFQSPVVFITSLERTAPGRISEIPAVMARYRERSDSSDTSALWRDMQRAGITLFTFSPGGDALVAIGWSERTKRFYRLLECC